METVMIYVVAVNVLAFSAYGLDKWQAVKGRWRISEKQLLGVAILGGSVGALVGMYVFRHKIRKRKFCLGIPVIFLVQIGLLLYFAQMQ